VIFTLRNISGAVYSHSKSRWFDMDTFNQWFVLLLHFKQKGDDWRQYLMLQLE